MNYSYSPLVIGATGGSGTREIVKICQFCGYYMISSENKLYDALDLVPFYDKWMGVSLSSKVPLTIDQNRQMFLDFQKCIKKHRENMPDPNALWGWKNARSLYLLPFFHTIYPSMKFIHVIRDGRDMALSAEYKKFLRYVVGLLDKKWNNYPIPHILMRLWKATNIAIAAFGETTMKRNYLRIRFEDLCDNPYGIIKALLKFLNIPRANVQMLAAQIKKPSSIGSWYMYPENVIKELEELGGDALLKFGYM